MKNSTGRKLLEKRYGKGCFMERAGIRRITEEEEARLRKIKGYKKIDRTISYHHIRERSRGGDVSIENGANLATYNHQWLHKQSPEVRADVNNRLQSFKASIDFMRFGINGRALEVEKIASMKFDIEDSVSIPLYDNTPEEEKKLKRKFNRARTKRETMQLIDDELYR